VHFSIWSAFLSNESLEQLPKMASHQLPRSSSPEYTVLLLDSLLLFKIEDNTHSALYSWLTVIYTIHC
jgi:hypothetical protein